LIANAILFIARSLSAGSIVTQITVDDVNPL
jgi:hypothetical protein